MHKYPFLVILVMTFAWGSTAGLHRADCSTALHSDLVDDRGHVDKRGAKWAMTSTVTQTVCASTSARASCSIGNLSSISGSSSRSQLSNATTSLNISLAVSSAPPSRLPATTVRQRIEHTVVKHDTVFRTATLNQTKYSFLKGQDGPTVTVKDYKNLTVTVMPAHKPARHEDLDNNEGGHDDTTCATKYYQDSDKNFEESGQIAWFRDLDAKTNKSSHAFKQAGNWPTYILKEFANWNINEACTIGRGNCNLPSCGEIIRAVKGNRRLKRRVWFTIRRFQNLHRAASFSYDAFVGLEGGAALLSSDLFYHFIWKIDEAAQRQCKIFAGLVKAVINIGLMLPVLVQGMGSQAFAATLGGNPGAQLLAGFSASIFSTAMSSLNVIIQNTAGDAIDRAVCAGFPQPSEDYRNEVQGHVNTILLEQILGTKGIMEHTFNMILNGTLLESDDEQGQANLSMASEVLKDSNFLRFTQEEEDILEDQSLMGEKLHKMIAANVVITTMKVTHAGMHCVVGNPPYDASLAPHRFQPEEGITCQRTNWRDSERDTAMLPWWGQTYLSNPNKWNFTLEDLSMSSWRAWRNHHYESYNSSRLVGNPWPNEIMALSAFTGIPVCFSSQPLTNFLHNDDNDDKVLPCICGDFYGNETGHFLAATQMTSWSGYGENGTGLMGACQTAFDKTRADPAAMFETYCNSHTHYPLRGEANNTIKAGDDPRCGEFLGERSRLTLMGLSRESVNCRLCSSDYPFVKAILSSQESIWEHRRLGLPAPEWDNEDNYNYGRACEDWVDKYGCEDEMKAINRTSSIQWM